jgi:hypothetical protein
MEPDKTKSEKMEALRIKRQSMQEQMGVKMLTPIL